MRAARRLLLSFTLTILTPGILLSIFGFRALRQERRDAELQAQERLRVESESLGHRLELELRDWQQAADELAHIGTGDPTMWPQRVRTAVTSPGAAVVLLGSRDKAIAYPSGQLLYELSNAPQSELPASINDAEALEIRSKELDRAIAAYHQLTLSAVPVERAAALHGLARTLAKTGRIDEAIRAYRQLEHEPPVRIASRPSDVLALFEISSLENETSRDEDALRLYRGLVEGRWPMERVPYKHYSEEAHKWIPHSAETVRLSAEEELKMKLSIAAERFVATPQTLSIDDGDAALAFWHSEPFAAIVLGPTYVRGQLLPADNPELQATLLAPGGETLSGAPIAGEPLGAYTLQGVLPLRLQLRVKDPAMLYAGVNRQQNLVLGMLAVLVALLAFGGYFTIQTLKNELAVAQMKSDFVSTVSHEFRSPLAGINQLGEMLRDGRVEDSARRQEYYGMIVAETQRLRRLVENVLDFARMEDGRKQYRFECVEPSPWLQEVAKDFQGEVSGRGFAVEARIPNELPAIVGDRETLTTAVHNLLDNAVKYSRTSNSVRLEASASDAGLSISVCDRGVGIREEDQPRIFEKFYRGGGDLARQVKGVGLGLNLVQQIVSAHGGTIDVDSKEGEGSTFTIRLKTAGRPA